MDAKALGVNPKKLYFFRKGVWSFQKSLRLYEYALNTETFKIVRLYMKIVYRYWMIKLSFVIPTNVFGADAYKSFQKYCN